MALVLWEGLEPTCYQLPFLQGISLRGYQSVKKTIEADQTPIV